LKWYLSEGSISSLPLVQAHILKYGTSDAEKVQVICTTSCTCVLILWDPEISTGGSNKATAILHKLVWVCTRRQTNVWEISVPYMWLSQSYCPLRNVSLNIQSGVACLLAFTNVLQ